jgi:hypothetical protein
VVKAGVAEQGHGDAQPLLHAEGEALNPAIGDRLQPGQPQDLGDPAPDAVALRDRQHVGPGGAPAVQGGRVQQRADLVQRADQAVIPLAFDQGGAGGGRVQTQDDPHRGRLARAVRAEEAGHVAGPDREAQPVHRGHRAEALDQPVDLDH